MHPPPPPSRPPKLRPGSSVGKCRGAAAPVGPHRVHLKSSLATLLVDDQLARANSGCTVTYVLYAFECTLSHDAVLPPATCWRNLKRVQRRTTVGFPIYLLQCDTVWGFESHTRTRCDS